MKDKSSYDYVLNKSGGLSLVDLPCRFSIDGSSILVIVKSKVLAYNITTGEVSRILETEISKGPLINIEYTHDDQHNLYGFSKCSTLVIWTWETGTVLREKKLDVPDDVDILTFNLLSSKECFITGLKKGDTYLATFCLETGQLLKEIVKKKCLSYLKLWSVVIGKAENIKYAAICNGTYQYFIVDLESGNIEIQNNYNNIRVISIAAHPTESCIAVGDALGRATLLHGNLFNSGKIAKEKLHWHALPLFCLTFSSEGNYLLTGGMEKVLVKWALGSVANKAKDQQFIPRCPGYIKYITTDNHHIALTLSNNSIMVVNAQLKLVNMISECGGLTHLNRTFGMNLIYHRKLSSLFLGGRPGHFNVFSTKSKKVIANVDITMVNQLPPTRANLVPIDMEITCAAVNADGSWLVTSEYRNDTFTYPEERLKFWESTKLPFKLNTCVVLSHGGCRLNNIVIDNKGELCLTSATDQRFRLWKLQETEKKIYWSCLTACYYDIGGMASFEQLGLFKENPIMDLDEFKLPYLRDYKKDNPENDLITKLLSNESEIKNNTIYDVGRLSLNDAVERDTEIGGAAISQDSSLIAIWFGAKLTIWDTSVCSIKTILSHPLLAPKGRDVKFGSQDAAHYLVCTTEQCLAVWNLLSCSIKWLVNVNALSLAADPYSNRMAVVTQNNDIFVFTPHESKPLLSKKKAAPLQEGTLKHCVFGSSNTEHDIRLYLMRNDCEILTFEPTSSKEQIQLEVVTKRKTLESNFSALVAEQQSSLVTPQPSSNGFFNPERDSRKAFTELFSAPAHTLPAVSMVTSFFLEQLAGMNIKEDELGGPIIGVDEHREHSSDEESSTADEMEVVLNPENDTPIVNIPLSSNESTEKLQNIVKDKFKWIKMFK